MSYTFGQTAHWNDSLILCTSLLWMFRVCLHVKSFPQSWQLPVFSICFLISSSESFTTNEPNWITPITPFCVLIPCIFRLYFFVYFTGMGQTLHKNSLGLFSVTSSVLIKCLSFSWMFTLPLELCGFWQYWHLKLWLSVLFFFFSLVILYVPSNLISSSLSSISMLSEVYSAFSSMSCY